MRKSLGLLLFLPTLALAQYKPAAFTDPDRLKKIEATYPVIDQIYKKYAEENHWPGVAYGIIVDGKLVHTVRPGLYRCAKKLPAMSKSELSALQHD
jgi:hypothetical protein